MPVYYYDTSAIVKYYNIEGGSSTVVSLLERQENRHYISRLTGVELDSAFARLIRTGFIQEEDFNIFKKRFLADLKNKKLQVVRLLSRHFKMAEELIEKHGFEKGIRTLDAIQLSVALDMKDRVDLNYFVCSDSNLCKIAEQEGLLVINPLNP